MSYENCYPLKVEKGFNSDIDFAGKKYHVQTEDWGARYGCVVSQIFCNGALIKSIKTPYEKILARGPRSDVQAIRLALRDQHQAILDLLISGQSDR